MSAGKFFFFFFYMTYSFCPPSPPFFLDRGSPRYPVPEGRDSILNTSNPFLGPAYYSDICYLIIILVGQEFLVFFSFELSPFFSSRSAKRNQPSVSLRRALDALGYERLPGIATEA